MTKQRKPFSRRTESTPPTSFVPMPLIKAKRNRASSDVLAPPAPISAPIVLARDVQTIPDTELSPDTAHKLPPAPCIIPLPAWQITGVAVTGLAHFRKGLPCQDAVAWRSDTRPILALSDGAGSKQISERGAHALVFGVPRFLASMEDAVSVWLDDPAEPAPEQAALWVRRLLAHGQGILADLAQAEWRSVQDFHATLLLVVVGAARTFWWQVGDGAIVVRHADGLRTLGDTRKAKGEYANHTCFVDEASVSDVQFGLLPTANIFGLALMSDGGAEKLVANNGNRVATRVGGWFDALTQERLTPDKIALAFHDPAMWKRTTLDDRSLILAARSGCENFVRPGQICGLQND